MSDISPISNRFLFLICLVGCWHLLAVIPHPFVAWSHVLKELWVLGLSRREKYK